MQFDLSANFFDLFGLNAAFTINNSLLVTQFQELQKQLHPDKFASESDMARRWSMQAASRVNEGYQTLKNDLRRATYLLALQGVSIDEETDTQMAPQFLMEQMEYREALEEAEFAQDSMQALDVIRKQLKAGVAEQTAAFGAEAGKQDWVQARLIVRQWQFLDKLAGEVKRAEERLDV